MTYDVPWDRRVALGGEPFVPFAPPNSGVAREPHRGYYESRARLPHVDLPRTRFVAFRRYDSFPAHLLGGSGGGASPSATRRSQEGGA